MAASSIGPGGSTSFGYDVDGVRNRVIHNATDVTHMIADKNRPYAQVVVERKVGVTPGQFGGVDPYDTTLMRYVYGDDLISQSREVEDTWGLTYPPGMVTQRRYYHYDGQMSTRQMTDDATAAEVKLEYVYDAFGIDLLEGPFPEFVSVGGFGQELPTVNQYRYTGEQYDDDVGMYYLRARYYAPRQGRFATRDPFEGFRSDPMSLHKYLYAHGNPVMNRDPSGLHSTPQIQAALSIKATLQAVLIKPIISGLIGAGIGGGASALIAVLRGGSRQDIIDATLSGALWGFVYGFVIGLAAGTGNRVLFALTLRLIFRLNLLLSLPILLDDREPASVKATVLVLLAVGAYFTYRVPIYAPPRTQTYFHYTSEEGYNGILGSKSLRASTGSKNARFGDGQYLTDVAPEQIGAARVAELTPEQVSAGQRSLGQVSSELFRVPWNSRFLKYFLEIDTTGLAVENPRPGTFLIRNAGDLSLHGRIVRSGPTLDTSPNPNTGAATVSGPATPASTE